ncbi:MAG: DinB family protein [Armatimonadetes bacterium]|nr:DinB family protein [Armatimonadota bacterium]
MTKQLLLLALQQGKDGLLRTFNAVPDDKLDWKPLDAGRSVLDLVGEAAQTPAMVHGIIDMQTQVPDSIGEMFGQMRAQRAGWSKADVMQHLETNHGALIAAIEGLSEEDLGRIVTMPMGGGMTMPLAAWMMMAYRTYISRFAQINYIQTLYGDTEMH